MTKKIFLVATARPRFDKDEDMLFDENNQIVALCQNCSSQEKFQESSKGRAGAEATQCGPKGYNDMLLQYVIPEIFAKQPEWTSWNIKMQHDNAPAHVTTDDVDVVAA